MPISQYYDDDCGRVARATFKETDTDGTFRMDGSVVRGTLGTLSQEEMAFMIWRQNYNGKIKDGDDAALRAEWRRQNAP